MSSQKLDDQIAAGFKRLAADLKADAQAEEQSDWSPDVLPQHVAFTTADRWMLGLLAAGVLIAAFAEVLGIMVIARWLTGLF
jgi:hypothetical protein